MFSRVLSQITSKRTGWGSHKYSVVSGIEALAQSALLCPVETCIPSATEILDHALSGNQEILPNLGCGDGLIGFSELVRNSPAS